MKQVRTRPPRTHRWHPDFPISRSSARSVRCPAGRVAQDVLTKTFNFPTFAQGITFVTRVAKAADAMNHHPDIDIRYTKVTCALSTHDAGGITERDLELAREIEQVAAA